MDETKMRADAALMARGLTRSRERARRLIEAGLATCNGVVIAKPSQKVGDDDVLQVAGDEHPYVSRGGLKLEKALSVFNVDVTGAVCLDIGASTGGFTDVLLKSGARKVYAVDVGTGQLDPRLQADPRVTSMEHTNARNLDRSMFPEPPTLAVMDVSFISIRLILPALFAVLGESGRVIALVKPQFEAGRRAVGKHGIVSSPDAHRSVLGDLAEFTAKLGWSVQRLDFSPIRGGDGNIEYLADLAPRAKTQSAVSPADIEAVVGAAHARGAGAPGL